MPWMQWGGTGSAGWGSFTAGAGNPHREELRRAHKIRTLSADEELAADILRLSLPAAAAEWHIRLQLFPAVRDAQFTPIACAGPPAA